MIASCEWPRTSITTRGGTPWASSSDAHPETKHPSKPVGCLGPEASAFLTRMLPSGTRVELEYDGEHLDRYDRTLAGVWLRDDLVNAEVARAGLGAPVQYNGQVKFLPAVERAAREAKRRRVGAYAAGVSCELSGTAEGR